MSRINGEKARSAIEKRNRTARREKTRATLAAIRANTATTKAPAANAPAGTKPSE